MNSTERDARSEELRSFFEEQLLPAARRRLAARGPFFAAAPDPAAESYYAPRQKTRMAPEDFQIPAMRDAASVEAALRQMWEALEEPEMAALAPALGRLAWGLRAVQEESDEVSPFIYVMF